MDGRAILFHPVFNDQWQQLIDRVKSLRSRLPRSDFARHPQVKLFKAVTVSIKKDIIESD